MEGGFDGASTRGSGGSDSSCSPFWAEWACSTMRGRTGKSFSSVAGSAGPSSTETVNPRVVKSSRIAFATIARSASAARTTRTPAGPSSDSRTCACSIPARLRSDSSKGFKRRDFVVYDATEGIQSHPGRQPLQPGRRTRSPYAISGNQETSARPALAYSTLFENPPTKPLDAVAPPEPSYTRGTFLRPRTIVTRKP